MSPIKEVTFTLSYLEVCPLKIDRCFEMEIKQPGSSSFLGNYKAAITNCQVAGGMVVWGGGAVGGALF